MLERELDVLYVLEVILELRAQPLQLAVDLGEPSCATFHRRDRFGRTCAGDDVFALRIGEDVAVRRVARERDARGAVVAHISEDHRLHVDRGSPVVGNAVEFAIGDGALVVPREEHGADRSPELLLRIIRE